MTVFELTFGVLGDLFGRKRLLLIGSALLVVGELVGTLTPGAGTSTATRALVLWIGQALCGIGAAALFPSTLAMIAAGTRTPRERGRAIGLWAAALSAGNVISPVAGGLVVKLKFGSDPNASWRWAFILVAVLGAVSFGMLGTAYATSVRLSSIQGFSPLKTSIAFHALDHAFNVGYFVCGAAAAVSFVLAAVALGGRRQAAGSTPSEGSKAREPKPSLS